MQEAAVLLAFGGNVQVYEHPPMRDGRLIEWRQRRLREVGGFVKARREVCQHSETIPQIAVLHSEHHLCGKRNQFEQVGVPDLLSSAGDHGDGTRKK